MLPQNIHRDFFLRVLGENGVIIKTQIHAYTSAIKNTYTQQ